MLGAVLVAVPACYLVSKLGTRMAGPRFGLAAVAVYIALPLLTVAYLMSAYRHAFVHESLPQLVGLEAPQWLALGVLCTAFAAYAPRRLVGAAGIAAIASGLAIWGLSPLSGIRDGLHETAWSIAALEWLAVAGVVGAARRSPWLALYLAGWLSFFVVRAAHAGYDGGAFWRSLAPVMPAAALLLSSLWFLVPPIRPIPRTNAR